jgi:hypothetical protein
MCAGGQGVPGGVDGQAMLWAAVTVAPPERANA